MNMKLFWIGYDLLQPGKDYSRLTSELLRLGSRKMMLSDWILRGNYTAVSLRDHFAQFIDANDRLAVAEINEWATRSVLTTPNDLAVTRN
jgi:hypothetical protein